jgi:rhomboid family GlyGly-CTERM serine protease
MNGIRIPIWTLSITAAAAVVFSIPALEALLVYNREAIVNGEVWRVVTGNAVHLSRSHLARDLVAFAVAGVMLEATLRHHFAPLCLAVASVIGAMLYLAHPEVLVYGGLSGVVTAMFVYLSLLGLSRQRAYRWLYITILAGVVGKIGAEILSIETHSTLSQDFAPLPEVHALGAVTALLLFVLRAPQKLDKFLRMRSNSAFDSDTVQSPLRGLSGARQLER